jgi:hypothetical protein
MIQKGVNPNARVAGWEAAMTEDEKAGYPIKGPTPHVAVHKQVSWKERFENPTVIAASVASLTTLCITLVTALSAVITANINAQSAVATAKISAQSEIDRAASQQKLTYLANAFGAITDPDVKLRAFIAAGVFQDDDCKILKAVLRYSPDCQPPK